MPIMTSSKKEEPTPVVDPQVGDTDNNHHEVDDVVVYEPETVATSEEVVSLESVPDPTPWTNSTAVSEGSDTPLVQVAGKRWYVGYYKQLANGDDVTDVASHSISGAYQQYSLINNMLLMVQGNLETETDENQVTTISGTAIITDAVVPNLGDHFVAELGTGRLAVFKMTRATRLSVYAQRAYEVAYQVVGIDDTLDATLNDLNSKVVITYHYDEKEAINGRTALLTSEQLVTFRQRLMNIVELEQGYLKKFYWREDQTLVVNADSERIYDAYLTDFVRRTYGGGKPSIRLYNSDSLQDITIYGLLTERRGVDAWGVMDTVDYIYLSKGTENPELMPLRYSGIGVLASAQKIDQVRVDSWGMVSEDATTTLGALTSKTSYPIQDAESSAPTFPDVVENKSYLFPDGFYKGQTKESLLEQVVYDWCQGKAVNSTKLVKIVNEVTNLTDVEQFYLMPIVLFLMRVSGVAHATENG